jgi:glycosyltransferase involved in cell wall biosynthesis
MEISVIFPAYNEEENIRATIGRAVEALRPLFARFEVLIVNDASRDRTGEIAEELAREHPQVRVMHNARNLGQGGSIVAGFREARYGLVIHNAMDYPFDLRDLAEMLPLLERADVVVAARDRRAGYSADRKLMSAVNRALLRTLFGLKLRDYNFVQLYRKEVWDTIRVESRSTAFLTPEALIRAHDMGFRIAELSTRYHPREKGVATSGTWRVISRSVRDMLRFWWKRTIAGRREYWAQARKRGVEVGN